MWNQIQGLDNCKKNDQVKEYIKKNNLDENNDEHLVQAALAVAGSGGADGLNDSNKQAPNKLLLKMTNATASIRKKMQKHIDDGKSVEEAAKLVSEKLDPKTTRINFDSTGLNNNPDATQVAIEQMAFMNSHQY